MEKVDLEVKKTILSVTVKDNEGNSEHIKLPGTGVDVKSTITMKIPIIPNKFEYVKGTINTGFVIQDKSGNQFVWVPTSDLIGNGIINGHKFSKQFGKRNFDNKNLIDEFIEHLTPSHVKSVEKYGGFYVSRYMMSKFENSPKSFEGVMPWTSINFDEAVLQAEKMAMVENWDNGISAHVIYAAEYDSIMQWIIESKVKSFDEIVNDSTNLGNYFNFNTECINGIEVTGNPNFEILNICDLAGNIWTWTMEEYKEHACIRRVIRGGSFEQEGHYSANYRKCTLHGSMSDLGFRTALYIK